MEKQLPGSAQQRPNVHTDGDPDGFEGFFFSVSKLLDKNCSTKEGPPPSQLGKTVPHPPVSKRYGQEAVWNNPTAQRRLQFQIRTDGDSVRSRSSSKQETQTGWMVRDEHSLTP